MLWICFAFLVIPGYITFKRRTFNLEGKINAEWSRQLGTDGRLRIQNQLGCCGYFSPFVEATVSQTCYARSVLPGCKLEYLTFERLVLRRWYTIAFTLVPLHIAIMMAGLLCSNHVTYRFGKGMMPKAYRLSMNSMAVIMDNYAKYAPSPLYFSFLLTCIHLHFVVNWRNNTAQTLLRMYFHDRRHTSPLTQCQRCPTLLDRPPLAPTAQNMTHWRVGKALHDCNLTPFGTFFTSNLDNLLCFAVMRTFTSFSL